MNPPPILMNPQYCANLLYNVAAPSQTGQGISTTAIETVTHSDRSTSSFTSLHSNGSEDGNAPLNSSGIWGSWPGPERILHSFCSLLFRPLHHFFNWQFAANVQPMGLIQVQPPISSLTVTSMSVIHSTIVTDSDTHEDVRLFSTWTW